MLHRLPLKDSKHYIRFYIPPMPHVTCNIENRRVFVELLHSLHFTNNLQYILAASKPICQIKLAMTLSVSPGSQLSGCVCFNSPPGRLKKKIPFPSLFDLSLHTSNKSSWSQFGILMGRPPDRLHSKSAVGGQ